MIRITSTLGPTTSISNTADTENCPGDITIPRCADLFRYEFLGGADTLRGRVIKAFMWLMDFWPIRGATGC